MSRSSTAGSAPCSQVFGLPISDEWASTIFTSELSIAGTICDPNLLLLRPYC
jgi:hypothetical protein